MEMRRKMKITKRGSPSPHSPPLEYLPSLGDLFNRQVGISVGTRRMKCPQTRTGHHLAHHHSLVSHGYLLTYSE
jgi:hypothetical protein